MLFDLDFALVGAPDDAVSVSVVCRRGFREYWCGRLSVMRHGPAVAGPFCSRAS